MWSEVPQITVVPGTPSRIVKVSGDGQQADTGTTLPAPFVVMVTDDYSNPFPASFHLA
ncbi:MAG: hypothetical protein QME81_13210 [bacterium]|nr:hypothetical protein [bacterium]